MNQRILYILDRHILNFFLSLVILSYVLRMAIPYLNYIFVPSFILYSIILFIKLGFKKKNQYKEYINGIKYSWWFIAIGLFAIYGLIISTQRTYHGSIDIVNFFIVLSIINGLLVCIKSISELNILKEKIEKYWLIIASIIAPIGLGKLYYVLYNIKFPFWIEFNYNTSISSDYNFYSLVLILASLIALRKYIKSDYKLFTRIGIQLLMFLFFVTIFFSTSRRSINVLFVFYLFTIFFSISSYLGNGSKDSIRVIPRLFTYHLLTISFLVSFFILIQSPIKKYGFISNLKMDMHSSLIVINNTTYSLGAIIGTTYDNVWESKFDPKNPMLGWGIHGGRTFTPVFKLKGKNVDIVPKGTIGYMLDSKTNANPSTTSAEAYTVFGRENAKQGDIYRVSIYCYVSKDYDGDLAMLSDGYHFSTRYDMSRKGEWHKLSTDFTVHKDMALQFFLYISKNNALSFDSLRGYVIFAHPEWKRISSGNQIENVSNTTLFQDFFIKRGAVFLSSTLFANDYQDDINQQSDKNPIQFERKFSKNRFIGPRLDRWLFAWSIYKEYPWWKKLFGGGFDYLNLYGEEFINDSTREDYPHNPIISAFLYSGIFGGVFYFLFLLKSFWLYFKSRKELKHFFIAYVIVSFYCFFSSNSHFSVPIYTILSVIPFFFEYLKGRGVNEKIIL